MSRRPMKSNGLGKLQADPASHLGRANPAAAMRAMLNSPAKAPAGKRYKQRKSKSR